MSERESNGLSARGTVAAALMWASGIHGAVRVRLCAHLIGRSYIGWYEPTLSRPDAACLLIGEAADPVWLRLDAVIAASVVEIMTDEEDEHEDEEHEAQEEDGHQEQEDGVA